MDERFRNRAEADAPPEERDGGEPDTVGNTTEPAEERERAVTGTTLGAGWEPA